jgi:alanyl-tRNA synthetase
MNSHQIRRLFLDYFREKNHTLVSSSPLVPGNDPTLLFTNAGMVQFKEVFLGLEKRSYVRAASSQRCVRAGGKHNDLENVGHTARHHTFFEMLGNFSFGDYFKREAIQYAWEFLTKTLKIPAEKLWVTVFEDDDEAADIWLKEMKIDPKQFSRCGAKDNFWAMGDTGPCGPCTEIFYDHGEEIFGGPPGTPDADGDRYIEIWNLVFMQFERSAQGELKPLPKPSVDTGMGLERLAAVMQGVHNNYDTDLFKPLIQAIAGMAGINDLTNTSLRVIADHIRSTSFLIVDGVVPSNEGRGYVLRRIIRRAIRHGNQLGLREAFFHQLVAPLISIMGEAYPELSKSKNLVERVLLQEEQQFARTLETGLKILEQDIAKLSGKIISGSTVFRLYDTYGFPVDLTSDIARERGLTIDEEGFEREMAEQRQKSQQASQFAVDYTERVDVDTATTFKGYEHLKHEANIIALLCEGKPADSLQTSAPSVVVLDNTPFYAEGGGQVGDTGWLIGANGQFEVKDTKKEGQVYLHYGSLKQGTLQTGDKIYAEVDTIKRLATALNHSATHLLHAALRKTLGEHVKQKGSLVEAERLRFDFTHANPLTLEEIKTIEHLVNQQIRANLPVETHEMSPDEATKTGALAFFGEKYGEKVRVLSMGEFSKELCGGTHVRRTGDIGLFKITTETGIAAGIRRLEAVTGDYAISWIDSLDDTIREAARLVKGGRENLLEKIRKNSDTTALLEKEIEKLHSQLTKKISEDLLLSAKEVSGVTLLTAEMNDIDAKKLRDLADQLRDKLGKSVVVLGCISEKRANLAASVDKALTEKIKANDIIAFIAPMINGKGGGRPDFAQAGGDKTENIKEALEAVEKYINNVTLNFSY